ncbi:MAG: glycosyltransferase, partial [Maribacter sp.]
MSNKIKILFILPSLKAGGAERVVSNLARTIDRNYFSTKLIIVGFEKDTVYNTEDIEVVYLNKSRVLKSVIPLFNLIKNEKPNIVMSSIGHVNLIMAIFSFFFTKCKFIGRQASVVSEISNFTKSKSIHLPRWLTAILYRRLDM